MYRVLQFKAQGSKSKNVKRICNFKKTDSRILTEIKYKKIIYGKKEKKK